MYYPEDLLRQIRESNDIVSVITEYIPLTKKGANHFGLCPFHGEKTPSFSVNEKEQFFHCFGCGAGGNVFTFLMQMDNLTFSEAVKVLADRAHIDLPEAEMSEQEKRQHLRRERMKEAATEAARFYYHQLARTAAGAEARGYLERRGVSHQFINKFGLGYAPVSREAMAAHLRQKGFTTEEMVGAGLLSGKENRYYDRFFNRLMFPIFDAGGKIIAFGGRVMGQGEPKYLNSPENEIFNKRKNLYGLNIAKKSRRPQLIVVEGYMDVLSLHQAGFDNAVASLGTALTKEQCLLMKRYFSEVALCYDTDGAGTNAARRAIPLLEEVGIRVKVIRVPGAKDPDEYLRSAGAEDFEKLIQEAMDPVDFEMMVLKNQPGAQSVEGQVKVLRGMAERLAQIRSDMERELHIRDVAAKMKVSEKNLAKEVEEIRQTSGLLEHRHSVRRAAGRDKPTGIQAAQYNLLAALVQQPELYRMIEGVVGLDDFPEKERPTKEFPQGKDNIYRIVAEYIFARVSEGGQPLPADIMSRFDAVEEQEKVSSMATFTLPEKRDEMEKFLTETIRTLKTYGLEEGLDGQEDLTALQATIKKKRDLQNLQINLPGYGKGRQNSASK